MTKLLSVKEAASQLGISERGLWTRIARDEVPHRRWKGRVLLIASELETFIAGLPGPTADEVTAKLKPAA